MNAVLVEVFKNYADHKSTHELMTALLNQIIELTGCDYGLIGETRYTEDGSPYSRFHCVYGFPEDSPYTLRIKRDHYIDFMQPDTLHSKVYQTKTRVICNDVMKHRHGKPMSPDHPVMKNFALFPMVVNDKVIGVIGLSGNRIEMTDDWADNLEPHLIPIELIMMLLLERTAIEKHKVNFLANVSHELRTPLNGIISITKMLQETQLDSEQKELLDIVAHCNIQLLEIINDILDYTKISSGKLRFNLKPFSLKKCITNIKQSLEPQLKKDIQMVLDYDSKIEVVVGDEVRVTQILLNLLNNSIKFTRHGLIKISVRTLEVTGNDTVMEFKVSDTGVGIASSKIKYIFDSFNQIANHLSSDCGVGLGLPITKYLVNAFNGDIKVESTEGQGTTMTFTLRFNNFVKEYSNADLATYFDGLYVLVITDSAAIRKEIFTWASKIKIKPIICSSSEIEMYLSSGMFKFEAIISIHDETITLPSPSVLILPGSVSSMGGPTGTGPDFDYVYIDDNIGNALSIFANHMYAINRVTDHTTEITVPPSVDTIKQQLKILVAEDNIENQKVITKMINKLGYNNITMTSDGVEFFMEIQARQYDIAFVDLKMPLMDGLTAVKKFKEKQPNNQVILVAVTASMSETIRTECYKAGMNGYITKPINRDELSVTLNTVVKQKISVS